MDRTRPSLKKSKECLKNKHLRCASRCMCVCHFIGEEPSKKQVSWPLPFDSKNSSEVENN